ncbi:hypothetical protein AUK10_00275, partial [Candidatus Gracilibacteria bacterium CG2_30_37_12]
MKILSALFISFFLLIGSSFQNASAYTINYTHSDLQYTDSGVQIYGISGKDFLAKGFAGQVDYIKNFTNGMDIPFVRGQTGDIFGSDKNDYFHGFYDYYNNRLLGGKGDDFYEAQPTYAMFEKPGEGTDIYLAYGNTGPAQENIENIISKGASRVYGNASDNLIFAEGKGSEIHGGGGNDVMLVNGLHDNFSGEDGIDTIIFPGSVHDYVFTGDPWIVTVKNIKTGGMYQIFDHGVEQYQFDDAFFGPEAGINTLQVGPDKPFKKIMDALRVAGDGDTIEVDSGVYEDDVAIITRSVTIRGVGGRAHFYAKSPSFTGKANFITMNANITFDNIEFSGNKTADRNGAGIRMEGSIPGGIITVKNCYFHNNEVGILAGNQTNGVLNIENTEFGYNGVSYGVASTVNVGVIKALNITNSYFHDTMNGHNVVSYADTLNITNSYFYDGTANTSFNISMNRGLNSTITGNTFVQTDSGENTHMILNTATQSSIISENTFINNASLGVSAIQNNSPLGITLDNNKLYNYKVFIEGNTTFTGTGNTILDAVTVNLPTPNTSVGNISFPNPQTIVTQITKDNTEFTTMTTIDSYTGRNITVGVGKDYSTLKAAIENALSGDRIYIDEGVYASDYAIIANKNIAIIGLGKGAELKKVQEIPNGKAILVSNTSNIYLENIIFSDSNVPDLNGAGIRYEGGTMSIMNCTFRNNENGILGGVTPVGKGKIWIYNSRFLDNGRNGTGFTHAIYIGEMDYVEIKNSVVRGTSVGHHIKSRARMSIIENNLLDDGLQDASYNIDLPNGGDGIIRGNTIIQSALSPNRTMVSYCAEKNPPNPGTLIVENNIFESFGNTAIGVKNFRNNQVILRNNTFKNVSTKFTGVNVTEENSASTVQNIPITADSLPQFSQTPSPAITPAVQVTPAQIEQIPVQVTIPPVINLP